MSLIIASSDVGRLLDHVEVLALLGVQVGVERQLGHADDAVHRRADFVAHVGQELALGPVRLFGVFLRDDQLGVHAGAQPQILLELLIAALDPRQHLVESIHQPADFVGAVLAARTV